jgi:hypothetical protein
VTLADGADITKDITLSPEGLGSRAIDVSLETSDLLTIYRAAHYITYNGVGTKIRTAEYRGDDAGQSPLGFQAPSGLGFGSLVTASAGYGEGIGKSLSGGAIAQRMSSSGSMNVWQQVAEDADSVSVSFPVPVMPVAPLSGGVIDPVTTTFRWVGPEDALYDSVFTIETPNTAYSVEVVSTSKELRIPSYADLGALPSTNGYVYWSIIAISSNDLPATADELTEAAGANAFAEGMAGYYLYPGESGYSIYMDAGEFILPDTQDR